MSRTIEIAEYAGVCYGVQRALDMAHRVASTTNKPIHTVGPLIHNPLVVQDLENSGVYAADDLHDVEEGVAIIRAHGVPPEIYREAAEKGLEIVDATCPFVRRVQEAAKKLSNENYQVIILGEPAHPEVLGIRGNAGENARVVQTPEELDGIAMRARVGIVVQTTQTQEALDELAAYLLPKVKELRIFNTICTATQERQNAARHVSAHSDLMIVIGGKHSGNTKRLTQICMENCDATHHIQSADELDPIWLENVDRIGITAGASTPREHIDAVVQAINDMKA